MTELKTGKNLHLTLEDRIEIQTCLQKGMSFKAIGRRIGKDPTTVSKEVKKHFCANPHSVKCVDSKGEAVLQSCPRLLRAPFVCNPCQQRRCVFPKRHYYAKAAQREYEALRSESRTGIPLNKEAFYEMDRIISEGIKRGQHLYHIMKTNELEVSPATVYRHLKRGYLSVCAVDFPRVVKFKPRKPGYADYVPKSLKVGRTYEDFCRFIEQYEISSWVEMDTVIGRIGGKAILTFDFIFCNFMAGLLIDNKSASEVTNKISALKQRMTASGTAFDDVFPLLLTDNGGEFANIFAFENDSGGNRESSLFFCDPYRSCQKPRVEKNHTLFRDIVPKGESFDGFSQHTVNLIFSHINSVKRKSLNGKTPFDLFVFTYGQTVASLLGISPIHPNLVIQSPRLLKHLN